jgi:hypothetical protein
MTYDWEGIRTRRMRILKICLALTVPLLVFSLGALNTIL